MKLTDRQNGLAGSRWSRNERIFAGTITPAPQDEALASLAPAIEKREGRANWELPARRLYDTWRAFTPWPGLFFHLPEGQQVKVLAAGVPQREHSASPGEVLDLSPAGLQVACGLGTVLEILAIQPEGKKEMSPWQYSLGHRLPERLP